MFRFTFFSIFVFILTFLSCERDDNVYTLNADGGPKIDDIIKFSNLSSLTIEADSFSFVTVSAVINNEAEDGFRDVTFSTSEGLFANSDTVQIVKVNAQGMASVSLFSNLAGTAFIQAQVESFLIDTTILFAPALPDDMLLTADHYSADTNTIIVVTTQLFRNPNRGKTSDPQKVFYKIFPDSSMLNSLIYPAFAYSENGLAAIEITNPFKVTGRFTIESRALSSVGDTLLKKIFIEIE